MKMGNNLLCLDINALDQSKIKKKDSVFLCPQTTKLSKEIRGVGWGW